MIYTADFHTHILPGIDDGAKNIEESRRMLEMISEQACGNYHCVAFTPHYKVRSIDDESVELFLRDREDAFQLIEDIRGEQKNLGFFLGAEVALQRGLTGLVHPEKLCMGDSRFIMLELPMLPYKPWMYEVVEKIRYEHKLIPMIAHFERYYGVYSENDYEELFTMPDALFQFTSSSLKIRKLRRFIVSLIRSGLPVVMGTDSHDPKDRIPEYHKGLSILKKHLSEGNFEDFRRLSAGVATEMMGYGI